MIAIGQHQTLIVDHDAKNGHYLRAETGETTILLPKGETRGALTPGETVRVFVYLDSEDRPVATMREPNIAVGQIRPLTVTDVTRVGAFLDWGLAKELLLPFHEQTAKVRIGRSYAVYCYLDKTGRPAATMKIYNHLSAEAPYDKGDWVTGYVYQINPEIGAFVAVDFRYHGLIPAKELSADVKTSATLKCRVTGKHPRDHKLFLSPRKQSYKAIGKDAVAVYRALREEGGYLPYNDHSDPAAVRERFDLSKAAFKRALGRLLRAGRIEMTDDGIRLKS